MNRQKLKQLKKIQPSSVRNQSCSVCLYYSYQKICQIHALKTAPLEICNSYTPFLKHTVVSGGSVSSK